MAECTDMSKSATGKKKLLIPSNLKAQVYKTESTKTESKAKQSMLVQFIPDINHTEMFFTKVRYSHLLLKQNLQLELSSKTANKIGPSKGVYYCILARI